MSVATLPLTVRALRNEIATLFTGAGVERPHDEARDIIAAVLDRPRFWPVEHAADVIAGDAVRDAAVRRVRGMPFAYAVGRAAFRHLTLDVDARVLIPRQETELLVDLVLSSTRGRGIVADVGCGSGCIALALASEGKFAKVIASDISSDALAVARQNAVKLHCEIDTRQGDLLTTLNRSDGITAIVSNPPYIAPGEMRDLPPSVTQWEPHLALVSENDGLQLTFDIIDDAQRVLHAGGMLALEVDSRRAQRVATYMRQSEQYGDVRVHNDFTGRERFVIGTRLL